MYNGYNIIRMTRDVMYQVRIITCDRYHCDISNAPITETRENMENASFPHLRSLPTAGAGIFRWLHGRLTSKRTFLVFSPQSTRLATNYRLACDSARIFTLAGTRRSRSRRDKSRENTWRTAEQRSYKTHQRLTWCGCGMCRGRAPLLASRADGAHKRNLHLRTAPTLSLHPGRKKTAKRPNELQRSSIRSLLTRDACCTPRNLFNRDSDITNLSPKRISSTLL